MYCHPQIARLMTTQVGASSPATSPSEPAPTPGRSTDGGSVLLTPSYSLHARVAAVLLGLSGLLWIAVLAAEARAWHPWLVSTLLLLEFVESLVGFSLATRYWRFSHPVSDQTSVPSVTYVSDRRLVEWLGLGWAFSALLASAVVSGLSSAFGPRVLTSLGPVAVAALGVVTVVLTAIYAAKSIRVAVRELGGELTHALREVSQTIEESDRRISSSFATNTDALIREVGRLVTEGRAATDALERNRRVALSSEADARRIRLMPRLVIGLSVVGGPFHSVVVRVANEGMGGANLAAFLRMGAGHQWELRRGSLGPSERVELNFGDVSRFPRDQQVQATVECRISDGEGREYVARATFTYFLRTNVVGWTSSWRIAPPTPQRPEMNLVGAS